MRLGRSRALSRSSPNPATKEPFLPPPASGHLPAPPLGPGDSEEKVGPAGAEERAGAVGHSRGGHS